MAEPKNSRRARRRATKRAERRAAASQQRQKGLVSAGRRAEDAAASLTRAQEKAGVAIRRAGGTATGSAFNPNAPIALEDIISGPRDAGVLDEVFGIVDGKIPKGKFKGLTLEEAFGLSERRGVPVSEVMGELFGLKEGKLPANFREKSAFFESIGAEGMPEGAGAAGAADDIGSAFGLKDGKLPPNFNAEAAEEIFTNWQAKYTGKNWPTSVKRVEAMLDDLLPDAKLGGKASTEAKRAIAARMKLVEAGARTGEAAKKGLAAIGEQIAEGLQAGEKFDDVVRSRLGVKIAKRGGSKVAQTAGKVARKAGVTEGVIAAVGDAAGAVGRGAGKVASKLGKFATNPAVDILGFLLLDKVLESRRQAKQLQDAPLPTIQDIETGNQLEFFRERNQARRLAGAGISSTQLSKILGVGGGGEQVPTLSTSSGSLGFPG